MELEHKAYWAVLTCKKEIDKAGKERLFQPQEIDEMRPEAYDNSRMYKENCRAIHDSSILRKSFKLGDRVLKFIAQFKFRDEKLKERWDGPYTITKVLGYGAFELKDKKDGTTHLANGHLLKLFCGKPMSPNNAPTETKEQAQTIIYSRNLLLEREFPNSDECVPLKGVLEK
ncbi:uncharacterized protein LOC114715017 [Neltuma alba]|uniref:uncharacterized protein LOC114715017 n=1 Tax=Neltuma alba TaxID=207710 RepID=UPI0010A3001C|nr:uncharacterized protein LOC114715017 [Prosopis alba]